MGNVKGMIESKCEGRSGCNRERSWTMCDVRYNKESGGERAYMIARQECYRHLHVRIFQRLNFGGSSSSCSGIPPFCEVTG